MKPKSTKRQVIRRQVKMKGLVVADLSKQCNNANNRLKEFSALYDVVKNERNKYVHLTQSSHQALAEMKEKIKILQNEASSVHKALFGLPPRSTAESRNGTQDVTSYTIIWKPK